MATGPDFHKAEMLLVKALAHMPVNAAADLVAAACDLPKRAMYERALALKNDDEA
jgi:16S rRNA (cytidine1402-2'-O)-methyltransferase